MVLNKASGTCIFVIVTMVTVISLSSPHWWNNITTTSQAAADKFSDEPSLSLALRQDTFLGYLKYLDTYNIQVPSEFRNITYYLEHQHDHKYNINHDDSDDDKDP